MPEMKFFVYFSHSENFVLKFHKVSRQNLDNAQKQWATRLKLEGHRAMGVRGVPS